MTPQMAFQRKSAPPPVEVTDQGDGSDEGVQCPNCECQFDPESGDVIAEGKPVEGGGYDDSASPQGADLTLPPGAPDAQAPAGMDAVTNAVASALAQHR